MWGLARAVQAENPGRLALLDCEASELTPELVAAALREAQLAVRGERWLVPRLARARDVADAGAPPPLDPEATVLITGGTGGLGAIVARHLVAERGVRSLALASRSGERAEGADRLRRELSEAGAEVSVHACDIADRDRLRALIESLGERRLGAVVHAAGVIDDRLLAALDEDSLDRVLAPKVDAAWYLHELTAALEPAPSLTFFSSASGVLGNPGQANYAAANAFLDALALLRRRSGLPGRSLAWGPWLAEAGMTGGMDDADLRRSERFGVRPIEAERGLAMLDLAEAGDAEALVPIELLPAGLRAQAAAGILPAVLRDLAGPSPDAGVEPGHLARRLAGLAPAEQSRVALGLVRTHVAAVLGHASPDEIDPQAPFSDLGFDSLAAVELRNRLNLATGLSLPPTLVFDHPTGAAVADLLLAEAAGGADAGGGEAPALEALAALAAALPEAASDDRARGLLRARLRALLESLDEVGGETAEGDLAELSDEEIVEMIDEELGAL